MSAKSNTPASGYAILYDGYNATGNSIQMNASEKPTPTLVGPTMMNKISSITVGPATNATLGTSITCLGKTDMCRAYRNTKTTPVTYSFSGQPIDKKFNYVTLLEIKAAKVEGFNGNKMSHKWLIMSLVIILLVAIVWYYRKKLHQ